MSERPQEVRGDEQGDLLEQIITQGLGQMNKAPAQTEAAEEAPQNETPPTPKQEDMDKAASPAEKKNRRSSVYLYLLILFGAAFLMLLLAYFVQRRSSEDAISDLRDTMTLSRQELLDEIRELESQVSFYQSVDDNWMSVYRELEEKYAQIAEEYERLAQDHADAQSLLSGWQNYWLLEQSYQAGEYEDCVAILLLADMSEYGSSTPNKEIADRQVEIIQELADMGLLPRNQTINISDYQDWIDAYLAKHPDHGPTGWANTNYDD